MRITELNIYPLKSGRGISLSESAISAEGLPGDRRAMLVDPSGNFITQRELPAIAAMMVRAEGHGFHISIDDKGEVLAHPSSTRIDATVWKSVVNASVATDDVNTTLSGWLGREVKFVFFDEQAQRIANVDWTGNETPVTFADGYQILVTTTASLAALNENMAANGEDSVGMDRFRPNIVLETDEPWAEDEWEALEINGIRFDLVKPCARCIMTTQDQQTGSRDVPSPMKAMGRIRMSADRRVPGVLFGWNVTPRGVGKIAVGDVAKVVAARPEGWAIKKRG
ncbi:MOSC domain-containing protein [Agrobacterium sp. rho-13.3]|uniref:MOSC domain-containing protein n=1 Tax=Agrobacterium sp. rho-13.3 TaxID=3072980 RepID=UPI002A142DF8|nr:MOSC domain-containing protein [Agrobacterium sp. rho-13.3]MDX8308886.1 MOSC domain-containing protein [Agrobacterium sp. rho-13.3]